MWKQADVHAAAKAIGKLVVGATARSNRNARAAKKDLPKWIDLGRVAQGQARAEEVGVGVQGHAGRRGVIPAEIADDAEPVKAFEIVGDGAADAVLVYAAGASQSKVGIADRDVDGPGARGDGENGQGQEHEDELFHGIESFRAFGRVPFGAEGEEGEQGCRSLGSSH